jgi:RNA polymerase sigma-70 factor (ECF subfamily)
LEALSTLPDKDLLQQIARGSEAAYRVIFDRYWGRIYSTAFMFTKSIELSRDLAQDVFARVWNKREMLTDVDKLESYLFIMARNAAFNSLRKVAYQSANDSFFEDYFKEAAASHPADEAELKELKELIEKGIDKLPPSQQTAFRLSRFQGLKHEEIAREMGIAISTVKSHIARAMQNLREHLHDHDSLIVIIWILLFL